MGGKTNIFNRCFVLFFNFFSFCSARLSELCKDPKEIQRFWTSIPTDTDILLTHGPPNGFLDLSSSQHHVGCRELLKSVTTLIRPKLHLFGHVHASHGQLIHEDELGKIIFINASLCNSRFRIAHPPIIIDLSK